MPHAVCYFEIPVADLERAIRFYEAVFEVAFERTEIDGNAMALFPRVDEPHAINGALAQGESYTPGQAGARVYFATSSIDDTLERAQAAGAWVIYPKTQVSEGSWVAEIEDSEGNCIALSEG